MSFFTFKHIHIIYIGLVHITFQLTVAKHILQSKLLKGTFTKQEMMHSQIISQICF